jgi:hypothetical protein
MVLCVTAQASAAVIQAVIVLTIVWSLYRALRRWSPMKDMKRQDERPPMDTYLKHYLDVKTSHRQTIRMTVRPTYLQARRKSIHGPASHECGVFGDFVMFCTVSGTYAAGSIVDISALNSDGELISVGMDFNDGRYWVRFWYHRRRSDSQTPRWCRYHVLRPSRQAQTLSLRIVNPLQDDAVKDTKPCEVTASPSVNKAMILNRGE